MKKRTFRRIGCALLAALLLAQAAFAAGTVEGVGQLIRQTTLPVARDTYFTTDTLVHTVSGREEERYVEYSPGGGVRPVVAYGSKLYGKSTVNEVATYVSGLGMTPVAAVNGDFFMTDTGIPIGLVITDGIIRSSDAGQNAVCFREDGSVFLSKPQLSVKLTAGGQTVNIEYVNKTRKYYGLYLFTPDYSATTRVSAQGTDIVLDNIEGELRVGGTVTATVKQVVSGSSALPIGDGQMIISGESSQGQDLRLAGITAGMQVSIAVTSPDENLSGAVCAVGAGDRLLTGGAVASGLAAGTAPRTAMGIREDGSCVFYAVDGRQSGYSVGLSLSDLAGRMLSLGCVDAVNLDGGGSTAMTAQYPGDGRLTLTNSPSDGSLRRCANFIFFVNDKEPTGKLGGLYTYPFDFLILKGASQALTVKAADTAFYPMDTPDGLSYEADNAVGSVSGDGVFTAENAGSGFITVGGAGVDAGTNVTVIETPSSVSLSNADTGAQVTALAIRENASVNLRAQAYYNGFTLIGGNTCFTWKVSGNVGSVTPDGVFTASGSVGAAGYLILSCGNWSYSYPVLVGTPPAVLADFESAGALYSAPGISLAAQSDKTYVRYGKGSARLTYSFDEAQAAAENTEAAVTSLTFPVSASMSGSPSQISAWVYGDGSGNTLYADVTAGGASARAALGTLNFTGYKYLSAKLPSGATALTGFTVARAEGGKAAGTLYIDRVLCAYGDFRDETPPTVTINPDKSTVLNGVLNLSASALDDNGAPPPMKNVALTLDGKTQVFTYNAALGELAAQLDVSDGRAHRVTVTASDYAGNLARASMDIPSSDDDPPFADISGHWSEPYADYLYQMGVMNGSEKAGKRYCYPDAYLTRAQMAVLMTQYMGLDAQSYAGVSLPFADAASIPGWALDQAKAMYSLGVLQGKTKNGALLFDPNARITRAEMMTVIGRALPKGYTQDALSFSDAAAVPAYAKTYVSVMTGLGIVSGFPDNTIRPANFVTRGEAAKMLSRLY